LYVVLLSKVDKYPRDLETGRVSGLVRSIDIGTIKNRDSLRNTIGLRTILYFK